MSTLFIFLLIDVANFPFFSKVNNDRFCCTCTRASKKVLAWLAEFNGCGGGNFSHLINQRQFTPILTNGQNQKTSCNTIR
jgi:hypothetical protein